MQSSTTDITWFWEAVLEDQDIDFYESYTQGFDLSERVHWPKPAHLGEPLGI